MTAGRPAHQHEPRKDILLVWTERCAREFQRETGADCGSCPDKDECQRQADRRIGGMAKNGRRAAQ